MCINLYFPIGRFLLKKTQTKHCYNNVVGSADPDSNWTTVTVPLFAVVKLPEYFVISDCSLECSDTMRALR